MVTPDVLVIGSVNQDVVIRVDRLPRPGETLLGQQQLPQPGGKGANQAVAVARLGASCAMVAKVGSDSAGDSLRANLRASGVDAGEVVVDKRAPTGSAVILVDSAGENVIVVSPGANGLVDRAQVDGLPAHLMAAPVTLLQLEVPIDAVSAAARGASGLVVLNPAPAHPDAVELIGDVDVLVPNEHELLALLGRPRQGTDDQALERAARELSRRAACIVTLGARGALVAEEGRVTHVPAFTAEVLDTTGAGDAFCAGAAVALSSGAGVRDAAISGAAAGACAVRALGAQSGMPTRKDVELLLAGTGNAQ